MKNYISGWRQQLQKEVAKAMGAKVEPAPAAEAAPQAAPIITSPQRPAPQAAPRTPQRPAPAPDIIDVPPRPSRPMRMPSMRVPRMPMEWIAFLGFLIIFKISTDATYAAMQQVNPNLTWWHCAAAQAVISVVERFMFAGNINAFTVIVLIGDALINAWGLVVDLLPNFFSSGLWSFISSGTDLAGYNYDPATLTGKLIALAVGAFLAWSGDALLDIAMKGR